MNELELFYKSYDEAVSHLPSELRLKAHVTRCGVDKNGTATFHDERGRLFAEVTEAGEVITPESKAEATKQKQDTFATKEFVAALLKSVTSKISTDLHGVCQLMLKHQQRLDQMDASAETKSFDAETVAELGDVADRLQRMEAALADLADNGIRFCGFWREGIKARRGDAVTHDGSCWRALRDTSDKPCNESPDWQLVARKGRDAR